jgi:tripartite-type tricarboxylate transporter receptor subunit TctC
MKTLLLCFLSVLSWTAAEAQTWPSRPVKVIVSQAAGSTPDIACRIIADRLSQAIGQQVVVENRPGSGNIIGAQAAARSAPDGYTIFFATAAPLVTNPYTYKSLPYDPTRDFTAVSMVAKGPFMMLVNPSLPVKTLADVYAYDKSNPGKLAIVTDGARNFSGILAAWLNKLGGTKILEVPYPNMPQGIQDVVAGRVPLIILAIPVAAPIIANGQLRPLAVSSVKSMPGFESVPPMAATFPGLELVGWFVFVAPTGAPPAAIERINREMDRILRDPGVAKRLVELGLYPEGSNTPEGTAEFIREQYQVWGKVVREIGLEPQ